MSVVERILAERAIGVLRGVDDPDGIADALAGAGLGVVEVTLDSEGALDVIARLAARSDIAVVAGTVRTAAAAAAAVAAGAEACVCPSLAPDVVGQCRALGVPVVPGALTPSEIEAAWQGGAALVKLFPARAFGPVYVADVLKPLAGVPLVCTGGVSVESAQAYLEAGAAAVGVSFRDVRTAQEEATRLASVLAGR